MLILVHRQWREKQAADIKKRDEMSERRREEIKRQANQSIDDFYMEHKERVERSIKENKWVYRTRFITETDILRCAQAPRGRIQSGFNRRAECGNNMGPYLRYD
jgi:Clathrin light chain